ncbi:THAP domain-containing protein [Phthorimaea operculella]|nr:THAP domain-containing protein [Phthorimaea operculella]
MVVYCAVFGCTSSSKNKQRLFYPFPRDEKKCSAWIRAIDRPDLGRITIQNLHEEYHVCDMHFVFMDHHKILLDDAVPSINLPQKSHFSNNSYAYDSIESCMDDLNKSTQTDFSSITESTQTFQTCIKTSEIACQTENDDEHDPKMWKVDNPLKRKLLITLAFDNKVPKSDDQSIDSIDSDDAPLDTKVTTNSRDDEISLMCQPDISSLMSETKSDNNKADKIKSEIVSPTKRSSKTNKTTVEKKPKQKRNYKKTKLKKELNPSTESSSESETEMDYDNFLATKLEDAIKMIQQQWKIHEKKYRKDNTDNNETADYPVEKLQVKQGRAYNNELKFLALNLFYSNPAAYKALRQNLNLPTEKTLRRIEVGLSTKLTPTVIKFLKLIVSRLKEEEKFCTMCANMLPLKEEVHKIANSDKHLGYHEINEVQGPEPASKSLVVILKGLYSDWKQPLITCYLKEHFDLNEVNLWLDQIIASLTEIGFKVIPTSFEFHWHL